MSDEVRNADLFPDAEQRTIAFYAACNIKALYRILVAAKGIPELEHDATDIWDAARQFFPEEFDRPLRMANGQRPSSKPLSKADIFRRLKDFLPDLVNDSKSVPTSTGIIAEPAIGKSEGLQCQFCGKPVTSTSGKTLHEKVCKSKPS